MTEQPQDTTQAEEQAAAEPMQHVTPFMGGPGVREADLEGADLTVWKALQGAGMQEVEVSRAMLAMRSHGITFGVEGSD